jgi:hypothetical protein
VVNPPATRTVLALHSILGTSPVRVVVRPISPGMIGDLLQHRRLLQCIHSIPEVVCDAAIDSIQKKHGQFLFCFSAFHPEGKPVALEEWNYTILTRVVTRMNVFDISHASYTW